MDKKIIHITHNDMDGAGCAILMKKHFHDLSVFYLDYDNIDNFIMDNWEKYTYLIITDVSPKLETIEYINNKIKFKIIDHHKTSKTFIKYPNTIYDTKKSATLLTFEWLLNKNKEINAYKDLSYAINDFDLWENRIKKSRELNIIFTFYGSKKFTKRFLSNPNLSFEECEKTIITAETDNLNKYLNDALQNSQFFRDKKNMPFAVVFAEKYSTELGDHVLIHSEAEYIIIINAQKKKVSLRSKKEFDVSILAQANKGGGHKNAAGFLTDFDFSIKQFLSYIGI